MADTLITGLRVLVVGDPAAAIVATLREAGAQDVTTEPDPAAAAERAVLTTPDAVVALGDAFAPLAHALDPLGLGTGPEVIAVGIDVARAAGGPAIVLQQVHEVRRAQRLRERITGLEAAVVETTLQQTRQLEITRLETLQRLSRIAEYRDDNSWEHTERVAQLASRIGTRLGLPRRAMELLRRTAALHDIGKIAIPDTILLKPGKLTQYEFEVVKTHTVVGAQVLTGGSSELMATAEQLVRSHHERWDGDGYPDGLAGEDIPLVGRLVHVADVFDILTHERPHKDAWSLEEAAQEISRSAGTQFDPSAVRAFEDLGPDVWRAPAPMRDASSA